MGKISQQKQIVNYLMEHGSATNRELVINCNINSTTKRISELRKMGFPIADEKIPNPNGTPYKRYFLREETI